VPNLTIRTAWPGGAHAHLAGGAVRVVVAQGGAISAAEGWGVCLRARAFATPPTPKLGAACLSPPPCPSSVKIKSKLERSRPRPARHHQAPSAAALPCQEATTWRS
jgi:hypothetical protein